MNNKAFVIVVILATFMAFGMISIALAANGPKTPNMEIHIYTNPDTENADLQTGVLDINDWPLTKYWIDQWALLPAQVTLRDYVELGMMEIDINNQLWPTGDSNNKFYTPASAQSVKAVAFRQAVACLTDRDSIVRDVLKGYGFRMDVPLPPFQSAYIDMINYTTSGVIYNFNRTRAAAILDAAGFTMLGDGKRQDPLTPGVDMKAVIFYIRQDDPNRLQAGQMLTTELRNIGISVNAIITEKTVCYKNVMVLYAYNLYTGGWSLSIIPNNYHDLYSSDTYYGPSIGWSQNYPGFCNHDFDAYAYQVNYPATVAAAEAACKTAGYLFLKYCAIVPMYCSKAVKAYATGWNGVINNAGGGVDNYYTFLNGQSAQTTWDYGFKSDIEQLNQVSSQWLWDQNVLGLMYESLMGVNPFNLAETEYWIANASSIGSWNAVGVGGDSDATYINYTIRPDVHWHNNMTAGPLVTIYDINFSFYFTKACGPGVAWGYTSVSTFDHNTLYPAENKIGVYYSKKSAWAYLWAGGVPILNPLTWGPMWNTTDPLWQTKVRTYDPTTADVNNNGLVDIYEDGTGAWIFKEYSKGNYVTLSANSYYYLDQTYIANRLAAMFHDGAGDVNKDGVVNTQDLHIHNSVRRYRSWFLAIPLQRLDNH